MKSTKGLLWKRNTLEGHGRINNLFSSGLWTLLYKQMMPGDVATILRNHKGSIQKTKTLTAEGGWARTSLVAQGKDSVLPMQGAWVWSPVRELDPTRMPQLRPSMAKINNKFKKKKKKVDGQKNMERAWVPGEPLNLPVVELPYPDFLWSKFSLLFKTHLLN